MGLVDFPYNKPIPEEIICVLCGRKILSADATIGPLNAEGEVSLLCNGHLWDDLKFIDELADYMAEERRKFFYAKDHNLMQFGALPDVRTLY
jgi:hypothetical protein